MDNYKIEMEIRSSMITPLQSDTLWGHVCWALKYLHGEKALTDFLDAYTRDHAPLVISGAFPSKCLPNPVLPPLPKGRELGLIERFWEPNDYSAGAATIKSLRRLAFVPESLIADSADEPMSPSGILEKILGRENVCLATAGILAKPCPRKYDAKNGKIKCRFPSGIAERCVAENEMIVDPHPFARLVNLHTAVDRLSGGALEGSLHATDEIYPKVECFEAYCMLDSPLTEKMLEQCLDYIGEDGFGRKKSSGRGRIRFKLGPPSPPKKTGKANAFMSLSNYVPAEGDPVDCWYRAFTKYGKLGGDYACSPVDGSETVLPFKLPVVMLSPGSVSKIEGDRVAPFYGRLVKDVHPEMKSISQYGLAYPYPLLLGDFQ